MILTLTQIRTNVLEWLEQPSGQGYWVVGNNFARLDQLINETYEEAVKFFENSNPFAWSAMPESEGHAVSLTAGTREYLLEPSDGIRKILEIRQPPSASLESRPVPSIEYGQRDERNRAAAVYWFVSITSGLWYLGLNTTSPPWTQVLVLYRPRLLPLTTGNQVPVALPEEHHNVIVYGTAMRCLLIEGRDAAGMAAMHVRALDQLRSMTGPMANPHKAMRLG